MFGLCCFLFPTVIIFYYLSKILWAFVSYILLGFCYFMQKVESGPFYLTLSRSGIIVPLLYIFILISNVEHILICLLTICLFFKRFSLFVREHKQGKWHTEGEAVSLLNKEPNAGLHSIPGPWDSDPSRR